MPRPHATLPSYDPQLALLVKDAPEGDSWLHEVKLDGFRIGCALEHGRATLFSRRGKDWTAAFPSVAEGSGRLEARTALLDGEVAALLPDGRTSLHAMHESATIAYFVFDLLHLDGEDLTTEPIEERKTRLRALLGRRPPAPLRYVDHRVGGGVGFFEEVCRHRLEGIISKAAGSIYRPGARNSSWQKVKCVLRQEFVIGGYEHSTTGGLGAVWLGYHDGAGRLVFAGKVGTGFQRDARGLLAAFKKIERSTTPFEVGLPTGFKLRDALWLEERMVCEVAFMEWTHHGHIRHPSYQGLRPDKNPAEVGREAAADPPELPQHLR
ncbi:MAG TPA: non-homologous end-joining DNA ligase [Polyangia bacterium]|nr:non-homologous end-joining DNA ligase [Polyangia bacterium]